MHVGSTVATLPDTWVWQPETTLAHSVSPPATTCPVTAIFVDVATAARARSDFPHQLQVLVLHAVVSAPVLDLPLGTGMARKGYLLTELDHLLLAV